MKPPQSSDAPRTEATASATFAVVRHGGHQYRVSAGDRLVVDRLPSAVGDVVGLEPVLLLSDGHGVQVDPASLEGIRVAATVAGHHRGRKIRVFTFKPKKRHRRTLGFRAELTDLVIDGVLAKGEPLPEPIAVEEPTDFEIDDDATERMAPEPEAAKPARTRRRGGRAAAAEASAEAAADTEIAEPAEAEAPAAEAAAQARTAWGMSKPATAAAAPELEAESDTAPAGAETPRRSSRSRTPSSSTKAEAAEPSVPSGTPKAPRRRVAPKTPPPEAAE
jgi:large subunit ribosomal protein L21